MLVQGGGYKKRESVMRKSEEQESVWFGDKLELGRKKEETAMSLTLWFFNLHHFQGIYLVLAKIF